MNEGGNITATVSYHLYYLLLLPLVLLPKSSDIQFTSIIGVIHKNISSDVLVVNMGNTRKRG